MILDIFQAKTKSKVALRFAFTTVFQLAIATFNHFLMPEYSIAWFAVAGFITWLVADVIVYCFFPNVKLLYGFDNRKKTNA